MITIEGLINTLNALSTGQRWHRVVVTYTFEAPVNRRLPVWKVGQAVGTVVAQIFWAARPDGQATPVWASLGYLTVRGSSVIEYSPETFTPYNDAKTVLEAMDRASKGS